MKIKLMTTKKDYCGPESNKVLSRLIPDKILGIDISDCCKNHDEDFQAGGNEKDFKKANKRFYKCLKCKFVSGVGCLRYYSKGFFAIAFIYYKAVKEMGREHFNFAKD